MPYVTIDAPAKINLRLKVVGKRADGYHFLSMLNEKLTLADKIFVRAEGLPRKYTKNFPIGLKCPKEPSLESESNLVVKAARVLAEKYGVSTPLAIEIEKNIPIGAGLGGGSSDAAATLLALNKLWGLYKPPEYLVKVGVAIGADVPFFFWNGPAHVTGIGETVDPGVGLPKLWVLLINPGFEVSTRWVYERVDPSTAAPSAASLRINPEQTPGLGQGCAERVDLELTGNIGDDRFPPFFNNLGDLKPFIENDLEQVVAKKHPEVDEIKSYLIGRDAKVVFMSGSGPTVVGLFETKGKRDLALLGSRPSGWKFYTTENLLHRRKKVWRSPK